MVPARPSSFFMAAAEGVASGLLLWLSLFGMVRGLGASDLSVKFLVLGACVLVCGLLSVSVKAFGDNVVLSLLGFALANIWLIQPGSGEWDELLLSYPWFWFWLVSGTTLVFLVLGWFERPWIDELRRAEMTIIGAIGLVIVVVAAVVIGHFGTVLTLTIGAGQLGKALGGNAGLAIGQVSGTFVGSIVARLAWWLLAMDYRRKGNPRARMWVGMLLMLGMANIGALALVYWRSSVPGLPLLAPGFLLRSLKLALLASVTSFAVYGHYRMFCRSLCGADETPIHSWRRGRFISRTIAGGYLLLGAALLCNSLLAVAWGAEGLGVAMGLCLGCVHLGGARQLWRGKGVGCYWAPFTSGLLAWFMGLGVFGLLVSDSEAIHPALRFVLLVVACFYVAAGSALWYVPDVHRFFVSRPGEQPPGCREAW
jgi:hypothetical protein